MSWYKNVLEKLQDGKEVQFRPHGNSMTPKVKSGDLVTLIPVTIEELVKEDIAFAKVNGYYYLHLVTAVKDGQVQISNNHGHVNGWTRKVFGKLTKVEK
jgi:phage repressor protein C with HTH and peptisase S24 domain